MEKIYVFGLAGLISVQRFFELRLSARNRAWAMSAGAQEYGAKHYPLFVLLHTGWMAGWLVESLWRGSKLARLWYVWLGLFAAAQALRYWAIGSLGHYWNTRILVIPGAPLVRKGPYRFISHPNYVAVALELACAPLMFGAWLTALLASVLNAILLLRVRIPTEEEALQQLSEA